MENEFIDFSPEDFKATQLVEPNWYPFRVRGYTTEPSKEKGIKLHIFDLIGLDGNAKDLPIRRSFPDTYRRMMIPFLVATGMPINESGAKGINPAKAVNKVIDVFVGRREWGGDEFNEAKKFRPSTFKAPVV